MAISAFIPQLWSAEVLMALRAQLVFGQLGLVNRDYEGDIQKAGDTVHIVTVGDPGVRDYTPGTDITWDELSDSDETLVINEKKYFAFKVDDVNKRQAAGDFAAAAGVNAAYGMSAAVDSYVSSTMYAAVSGANLLATGAAPLALASASPNEAYDNLVIPLRSALSKAKIPTVGRWLVVPTDVYGLLLRDSRFIKVNESGTEQGLRNGIVGRIAGFDVYESQTCPTDTGHEVVIAGHPMATTYADQLVEMEARRLENRFGDGIRGLHVFGAKAVRPTALAAAPVTIS